MSHANSKVLIDALSHRSTTRIPIWFMRQAGRSLSEYRAIRDKMETIDMFLTPKIAAQITLQPIKRFDYDAAIVYADILHVADALGLNLSFERGFGPRFKHCLIDHHTIDKIERNIANFDQVMDKLKFIAHTLALVKPELSHQTLIGFAGSPFSVGCYMVEGKSPGNFINTKRYILTHTDEFLQVLNHLTKITIEYLKIQIDAGAEALQLFESHAHALSYQQYNTFNLPYMLTIFKALKCYNKDLPLIYYINGVTPGILKSIQPLSKYIDCLSIDHRTSLQSLKNYDHLNNLAIQGNLDPLDLYGSSDYLTTVVNQILTEAQCFKDRFIFNLGNGLTPDTPIDSIKQVIQLVHEN